MAGYINLHNHGLVMAGPVPATYVLNAMQAQRRGWPWRNRGKTHGAGLSSPGLSRRSRSGGHGAPM